MTDSKTTEVLIIGAGAAGLSAAISACDSGAKVIVIEKELNSVVPPPSLAVLSGCPVILKCKKRAFQTAARTRSRIFGR